VGGGTTPGLQLPTRLLRLTSAPRSADQLEAQLRASTPPVIARIEDDRLTLDLRTVNPDQDETLARTLAALVG